MKSIFSIVFLITLSNAHFLAFLPNSDIISKQEDSTIKLNTMFIHPFEQTGMHMTKPKGVFLEDGTTSLALEKTKKFNHQAWSTEYKIKRPGVYKFFVKPDLYFEEAEGKFISHVPKVIISAFGREDGWDEAIGLDFEIVPLVKPFGLYSGNLFQGKVFYKNKAMANIEVEVELYNEFGLKAASDVHITQVVKTDDNGIFSFVMNHKGWWGFAALIEKREKEFNSKKYPIEDGALIWIKAY